MRALSARTTTQVRAHDARFETHEQGYVLIVVAVAMVVMVSFVALVIDLGNGRQVRRQAQATADASAIAAAEEIEVMGKEFAELTPAADWARVVTVAKQYAWTNYGTRLSDWVGCQDPGHLSFTPDTVNSNTCISSDRVEWPDPQPDEQILSMRIRVRTPTKTIETTFGRVLDQETLQTQAVATAGVTRKRTVIPTFDEIIRRRGPCAICVLGPGFAFDGQNGDITVTGGAVVVNADPPTGWAAYLNPNGHVQVTAEDGIGGPSAPNKWFGDGFDPDPEERDPVDDPLAAIVACGATGHTCPTASANANSETLNPGVYKKISGSHTLNPGIYVITDEIVLNGNDLLVGEGVMLYFACTNYPNSCANGENGARLRATGNGAVVLTAPTQDDCDDHPSVCPYVGLTIFADRNNTSTFTFRGNGTSENGSAESSSGTIYIKSGTFDLRGNGYTLASQLVVGYMTMEGNPSGVTVYYDPDRNYYQETTEIVPGEDDEALSFDATGLCERLPCEESDFGD